jgi:hypothetical protein
MEIVSDDEDIEVAHTRHLLTLKQAVVSTRVVSASSGVIDGEQSVFDAFNLGINGFSLRCLG